MFYNSSEMSVDRPINQSLIATLSLLLQLILSKLSVEGAFRYVTRLLCCTLHLLHWIAISLGKGQLHRI